MEKFAKTIVSAWADEMLDESDEPVCFHECEQHFSGRYFSEGAQDVVYYNSRAQDDNGQRMMDNTFGWTQYTRYVSFGWKQSKKLTLDQVIGVIKKYFEQKHLDENIATKARTLTEAEIEQRMEAIDDIVVLLK